MTEVCTRCPYRLLTNDQQRIFRVLLSAYPGRLGLAVLATRLGLNGRTIMVQICHMRRNLVGWSIPLNRKRRGYRLVKAPPIGADRFYQPAAPWEHDKGGGSSVG